MKKDKDIHQETVEKLLEKEPEDEGDKPKRGEGMRISFERMYGGEREREKD